MSSTPPIEGAGGAAFQPDPEALVTATTVVRWRWIAWIALIALLYYPIFFARPVFDDLAHVEFAAQEGWHLLHIGPIFFRPAERILIGLNWMLYGDNFWIVKSVGLIVFVLNVALVYDLAKRIVSRGSSWAPFIIATIFLVHPMHVSAVGKIDTFSEHLASLFALLIVRCAIGAAEAACSTGGRQSALRWAIACAPLVLLGMLSKEAFAGFAAATPLFFMAALGTTRRESRRVLAWLVVGEGIAALAYFSLRIAFGFPLFGAHLAVARYQLHLGMNVPMNLAAELASIGFPGSTLALFVRFNAMQVATALLVLAAFLGLFRNRLWAVLVRREQLPAERRAAVVIVLIAAVAACFPTCLIPELISENQTALALPFVALLALAAPLSMPLPVNKEPPGFRVALACTCVAGLICMSQATSEKAVAMRATSDQAYHIGDLILARVHEYPSSAITVCFEPGLRNEPVKYSVFSMPEDRAALFQLSRLRVEQPDMIINVEDLRRPGGGVDPSRCSLRLDSLSVTR